MFTPANFASSYVLVDPNSFLVNNSRRLFLVSLLPLFHSCHLEFFKLTIGIYKPDEF